MASQNAYFLGEAAMAVGSIYRLKFASVSLFMRHDNITGEDTAASNRQGTLQARLRCKLHETKLVLA
jgi:hypothetical protein